jgi:hypothetical protein
MTFIVELPMSLVKLPFAFYLIETLTVGVGEGFRWRGCRDAASVEGNILQ